MNRHDRTRGGRHPRHGYGGGREDFPFTMHFHERSLIVLAIHVVVRMLTRTVGGAVRVATRMVFRYRSELAPLGVGLTVASTGAWLHATSPGAWPWPAFCACTAAWLAVQSAAAALGHPRPFRRVGRRLGGPRLATCAGRLARRLAGWLAAPSRSLRRALPDRIVGCLAGPRARHTWAVTAHVCAGAGAGTTRVGRWAAGRVTAAWARTGRPVERLYACATLTLASAWLSAATAWGATTGALPTLWWVCTLGCSVPWWTHRRRRARVRLDRTMRAWPDLADLVGLSGSRMMSGQVNPWGWSARVALRAGQTSAEATARIPAVETVLRTRPGAVRVEPDPARSDHITLRVIEADPHAAPLPYPNELLSLPGGRSVRAPVDLGVFEDATPARIVLAHRHALIGGATGSGKSGVLNVVLAQLTTCHDVAVLGIDMKGGMELRPWARCLAGLAVNARQADAMLSGTLAELDRRADSLGRRQSRLWDPSPARPAVVVVIDEYAELPGSTKALVDSVARRGRAPAITLVIATQRPTQEAMGGGAVRSQLDTRICLRVRERRDIDLVLGQGMHTAGWRADLLDAPGKFLVSSPEHTTPRRARAYLLTDHDVAGHTHRNSTIRPPFTMPTPTDPDTPRFIPTQRSSTENTSASGNEDFGESATPTASAASRENTAPDPEILIWRALDAAPDTGISVAELERITGRSRSWVYQRLTTGRARQTSRGRWRAAPTTNPSDRKE